MGENGQNSFGIVREKIDQAISILDEKNIDAWLIFVRETRQVSDPTLELILGLDVTWQTAFIFTRTGRRIAIAGRFDVDNIVGVGGYDEVLGYDQSIRPLLAETLRLLDPKTIAINYSESDPAADGLTHGMWQLLFRYLGDTPYTARMISSEPIVAALRGRKTAAEVERIKNAIRTTEEIAKELHQHLRPGLSEADVAAFIHRKFEERGVEPAWEPEYCPIVAIGPEARFGHSIPSDDRRLEHGQTLVIDVGVKQDGYVSDIQRCWYLLEKGETSPPVEVQKAFDAVLGAIRAAEKALKPGVPGWEVDRAARTYLTDAGYPEYQHATGHQIGRTVHDGAAVLGPKWERYGDSVYIEAEEGNVFTLELGVTVEGRGYIGLEEDVIVRRDGVEYLTTPQREILLVQAP